MSIKVLFADDSVTVQKVAELAFEGEDVTLTSVDSGDKVIEKLKESKPDVVIADISMPGMNGLDLCEWIKKNENYRDIPVLLLRSEFDEFDLHLISKVGADDCITKPFKSDELIKKVKDIAGRKSAIETVMDFAEENIGHQINLVEDIEEEKAEKNTDTSDLKLDDEIIGEEIISEESLSPVEIVSPETKMEEEKIDTYGLLDGEDIEKVKAEIEKIEEDENILENGRGGEIAEAYRDIKNLISKLEQESITEEKIKGIVIKAVEDAFERKFGDFFEKGLKNYTEKLISDTTEKLVQSLTPQLLKTTENIVYEIIATIAESFRKKENEKMKSGEIS